MASVIGVLFFIVLLMAMNITSAAAVNSIPAANASQENDSEYITKLEKRIVVLKEQLFASSKRLQILGAGDSQILSEIRKCEQQLKSQIGKLAKVEADADKAKRTLITVQANTKAIAKQLEESRSSREKIKRKDKKQPNVSYIIDSSPVRNRREPWLVVVSAGKVRVLTMKGHNDSNFTTGPKITACNAFLAWTQSQDPNTHYFVLLIKPSVDLENLKNLMKGLKSRSFNIGTDLIPEDWQPGFQRGGN